MHAAQAVAILCCHLQDAGATEHHSMVCKRHSLADVGMLQQTHLQKMSDFTDRWLGDFDT